MSLDILNQMIRDTARVALTDSYSRKSVILAEPQQPDSCVVIRGIPEDAIVIKIDTFPDPGSIFTGAMGECRRADYVIIADVNNKKRVLFIEMKRTKAPENHIVEQLKGSTCIIAYCKEIARHFYNCRNFLADFKYRYVSFSRTSISKTGTRTIARQARHHDRPERMLKISYPNNIQYNHLVGA